MSFQSVVLQMCLVGQILVESDCTKANMSTSCYLFLRIFPLWVSWLWLTGISGKFLDSTWLSKACYFNLIQLDHFLVELSCIIPQLGPLFQGNPRSGNATVTRSDAQLSRFSMALQGMILQTYPPGSLCSWVESLLCTFEPFLWPISKDIPILVEEQSCASGVQLSRFRIAFQGMILLNYPQNHILVDLSCFSPHLSPPHCPISKHILILVIQPSSIQMLNFLDSAWLSRASYCKNIVLDIFLVKLSSFCPHLSRLHCPFLRGSSNKGATRPGCSGPIPVSSWLQKLTPCPANHSHFDGHKPHPTQLNQPTHKTPPTQPSQPNQPTHNKPPTQPTQPNQPKHNTHPTQTNQPTHNIQPT